MAPTDPIDVDRARADTPGCDLVVHLNHAGASLVPRPVLDAQIEWLQAEALTGGYELGADREAERRAAYDEVAALVGGEHGEIALVENATFAWHQAFWSLPLRPGDRILTCTVEYASSYLSYLQAERRRGVSIEVIPDDEHGQLSVDALARLLDDRRSPAGVVAVTHVPTNGGLVNPVEEVGALCREAGVPFVLDACQSVGQMPVDVNEIGLHRLVDLPDAAAALADVRDHELERFSTHMVDDGDVLVAMWAPDAGYESGDLAAAGPRHRLVMEPGGWHYHRWE